MQLEIRDRGPGLAPEVQQRAGQPFFTTKGHGFGIGLFLANATIERFGGKVAAAQPRRRRRGDPDILTPD